MNQLLMWVVVPFLFLASIQIHALPSKPNRSPGAKLYPHPQLKLQALLQTRQSQISALGVVELQKITSVLQLCIDSLTHAEFKIPYGWDGKLYLLLSKILNHPDLDDATIDIRRTRDRWIKTLSLSEKSRMAQVEDDEAMSALEELEQLHHHFSKELAQLKQLHRVSRAYNFLNQSQIVIQTAMLLEQTLIDKKSKLLLSGAAKQLAQKYYALTFPEIVSIYKLGKLSNLDGDLDDLSIKVKRMVLVVENAIKGPLNYSWHQH